MYQVGINKGIISAIFYEIKNLVTMSCIFKMHFNIILSCTRTYSLCYVVMMFFGVTTVNLGQKKYYTRLSVICFLTYGETRV